MTCFKPPVSPAAPLPPSVANVSISVPALRPCLDGLLLSSYSQLSQTQISQGRTPPIKPFLALAFPISASLYIAIAEAHASAEEKKAAQLLLLMQPLPPPRRLLPNNRITLAYMSTDLGDHPVSPPHPTTNLLYFV